MTDKKTSIVIALIALVGIAYAIWAAGTLKNDTPTGDATTNVVANGILFEGKITNKNVEPMTIEGVGVYDRNCVMMSNGLTNCHGGIKTDKYGVLDFNYQHDMAKEPCIAPNEKLVVTILDSAGNAKVQKLY